MSAVFTKLITCCRKDAHKVDEIVTDVDKVVPIVTEIIDDIEEITEPIFHNEIHEPDK